MVKIIVPGVPIAKGRARSARMSSGKVIHYTPKKTANYESLVAICGLGAMGFKMAIDCACRMDLVLYMPIPKSWSLKKKKLAIDGKIYPTSKPDSSNVLKAIEDALNGIVYLDDSQIIEHSMKKIYSEDPRAEIEITELRQ